MNCEFIRFQATDGVELQGWLSGDGDTAVLHIHGMSGNGYENGFLDNLRSMYNTHGIGFLSIDTRGRGIISDFKQGDTIKHAGSCFELLTESEYDIKGAIQFLRTRGFERFILQGHSLGCSKVVNYLLHSDEDIDYTVLLAPTDMVGWARTSPNHSRYVTKATNDLWHGRGEALVGSQCWPDQTPLSAQTYMELSRQGGPADIYGDRPDGALLRWVPVPTLIIYGSDDIGILEIDGSISHWLNRVEPIVTDTTQINIIDNADHRFTGIEDIVAQNVETFMQSTINQRS